MSFSILEKATKHHNGFEVVREQGWSRDWKERNMIDKQD